MSMNIYPVMDYGLTLKYEELCKLMQTYYGDDEDIKELKNSKIEYLDRDIIDELIYGDTFFFFEMIGNFEGEFTNFDKNNSKYFDDTLYYIPLKKTDIMQSSILFNKYENMEEIYKEISNVLDEMKLKYDMDFIKKNTGIIVGTYYG